jgi:hypothetical protein
MSNIKNNDNPIILKDKKNTNLDKLEQKIEYEEIIELTDIIGNKSSFNTKKTSDSSFLISEKDKEPIEKKDDALKTQKISPFLETEKNTTENISEEKIEAVVKKVITEMYEDKINAIFEKVAQVTLNKEIKNLKKTIDKNSIQKNIKE